ncbi:MAG: 2-oxoglutarate ferredoxin oxidoreductase subunit alpha [Sulfurimonas sp.]|jgi:2-oxoglutarate ferredoxin oxidoreductase subunit alpha|uniref:2-oxoacid:acceptor oxidoreductase subunit alpha n=1 Tax=Sulfurimonas sp. TaxID=2022749 RepID=UPI0039E2C9C4
MTKDELSVHNGRNGKKAYIAYKGKVYDVTSSSLWKNGEHEGMHNAGLDLTPMMENAPHGDDVFEKFPVVAVFEEEKTLTHTNKESKKLLKERLRVWYKKYHPHPMVSHFPIVLHIFAAVLDILFFFNPKEAYALPVYYTFFVATVLGLLAMITGLLSWWINYNLSKARPFIIKIIVSLITLLLGIIGIMIYVTNPNVVYDLSALGITYHFIVLVTGINVIILGYYGGKITWGDKSNYKEEEEEEEEEEVVSKTVNSIKPIVGKLPIAKKFDLPFLSESTLKPVKLSIEKEKDNDNKSTSISILIGGAAGTGIETLEKILNNSLKNAGYYVFSSKEYMSRVRGGSNTILIRISDCPIKAACWDVDIFIAIDNLALKHAENRCTSLTLILADEISRDKNSTSIAIKETVKKLGNPRYANTYISGVIFGLLNIEAEPLLESVTKYFTEDKKNVEAVKIGLQTGMKLDSSTLPKIPRVSKEEVSKLHLMDGTTASGFGFLTGGCNFVASYPMSPSTGVLNFMASMSKEFDIVVEQSEDEIASLHMVLGAWYGGARALTTTSGGGFALMSEALSLSGMSETPAVIYLAQRPGPATGMPTRTEQGDLNLALHSGHGAFQRILLAPGNLKECIDYAYLAFELADRYQLPVIFLTDQYLADSMSMIEDVDFASYEQRRYITKTKDTYKRYIDLDNGVSPRGIPGFGIGLVCSEGHEHDERSQITEDYNKRVQMALKRSKKETALIEEAIPPKCYGDGDIAVIGWGSTQGAISEALKMIDDSHLTQVHFTWIHPLNPEHLNFLRNYKHIIVVENNADGAFTQRLKMYGIKIDKQILQFNGFAFFADQLKDMIVKVLRELS